MASNDAVSPSLRLALNVKIASTAALCTLGLYSPGLLSSLVNSTLSHAGAPTWLHLPPLASSRASLESSRMLFLLGEMFTLSYVLSRESRRALRASVATQAAFFASAAALAAAGWLSPGWVLLTLGDLSFAAWFGAIIASEDAAADVAGKGAKRA